MASRPLHRATASADTPSSGPRSDRLTPPCSPGLNAPACRKSRGCARRAALSASAGFAWSHLPSSVRSRAESLGGADAKPNLCRRTNCCAALESASSRSCPSKSASMSATSRTRPAAPRRGWIRRGRWRRQRARPRPERPVGVFPVSSKLQPPWPTDPAPDPSKRHAHRVAQLLVRGIVRAHGETRCPSFFRCIVSHMYTESNGSPAVVDGVDHRSHPKVQYVVNLYSRGSNLSAARAKPAHPSCVRSDSERFPSPVELLVNSKATRRAKFALARHERTLRRLSAIHDALRVGESRRSSSASSRRNAGELTSSHPRRLRRLP